MSDSHTPAQRRVALPSMAALRAFEAAGRLLNFTRAATELHLTQSAISHQVRDLEAHLGVALFVRETRGLSLSEAGHGYLPFVREAMERLRLGTDTITSTRRATVLTVSVSPNFAAKWLVPRLGAFSSAHPDLDLRISAAKTHVDFATDDIDLAVRHGDGDWPHLHVARLCAETLFPVCSPALLGGQRLACAADLAGHVLLHDRSREAWRRWLAFVGAPPTIADAGPVFSDTSLAIDAAVAGQGVALARSALASLDLAAARLVRPLPESQPASFAYWVVCARAAAALPKVQRFRDWLLEQAGIDAQG